MTRMYFLRGLFVLLSFPFSSAAQSAEPAPTTTIHASSDLVVVDVTVTDSQQNPVHHLTAGDFKILEDGHLQTVKNFEEHSTPTTPPPITPIPKLEPGTYTNFTPAPASGPLTILVLDKISTPAADQISVHKAVLKFLKEAKPGTEIAIFSLGESLRLISGFTTDLDEMRTLMEKDKPELSRHPLYTVASMLATGSASSSERNFGGGEAAEAAAAARDRAEETVDELNQIGRYLGGLPGRKNIVWFSASFPFWIPNGAALPNPSAQTGLSAEHKDTMPPQTGLSDDLKDVLTMMSHSQIAVYPVDSYGLRSDPTYDAESDISFGTASALPTSTAEQQRMAIQSTNAAHSASFGEMFGALSAMQSIAEATGGKFFFASNDLAGAIGKAIAAGSNYYTIAYVPNKPPQNGYRKIKVEVAHKGVTLAYRRGYYSFDRRVFNQASAANASRNERAPNDPLNAAMMRAAPAPTEIMLLISARPSAADPEPAAALGNSVEAKVTGPFRRYTVLYNIAADNLDCPATPDGVHHCSLQILALVYESFRGLVNTQATGAKLAIPPARYDDVLSHGLDFKLEISVPTEDGTYFIRAGVKDVTSGRIGALELPVAETE